MKLSSPPCLNRARGPRHLTSGSTLDEEIIQRRKNRSNLEKLELSQKLNNKYAQNVPNDGRLVLLGGQVTQEQGRVDIHGPPQQPGEEAARVSNPEPGAAVPSLSQLPPPAPVPAP